MPPAAEKQDSGSVLGLARKPSSSRVSYLGVFWFVVFPALSVILGALYTENAATTREVPFLLALGGNAVGLLYLLPEFLVSAGILFAVSWAVFSLVLPGEAESKKRILCEPVLAFFGVSLGISLEFPAILNNSIFRPFQSLPLVAGWIGILVLLLALAVFRTGVRTRKLAGGVAAVLLFVAFGWGLTQLPVAGNRDKVNQGSTVILGVDSMGLLSNIGPLYEFTRQNGGAWYERAVTPGLLTNAVWTAIVQHRPIHETGTTLIFQTPDWSRSPFQLVHEAEKRGFQTWSYFTGQNTIYMGSIGGFDHDRSGPMGWLDNATVGVKNGSIFVSFFASRLPWIPFSHIRRNQAGTYAFDIRATVHGIFTNHEGPRPVFAVAHLGYLHDDCYPRMAELSRSERRLLLTARIDSLRDLGSEWQLLSLVSDRLHLRDWKNAYIQRVLTEELQQTAFLKAQNHNKLVILADHGVRAGLTVQNFSSETYYRVPLITFGLPVRDLLKPISLLDIASLVGIEDPTSPNPADPVVEYINFATNHDFVAEISAAKWTPDGRITFPTLTDKRALGMLRSYAPFSEGDYGSTHASTQGQAGREISHSAKPSIGSGSNPDN